jgi:hypothetical protein
MTNPAQALQIFSKKERGFGESTWVALNWRHEVGVVA